MRYSEEKYNCKNHTISIKGRSVRYSSRWHRGLVVSFGRNINLLVALRKLESEAN